MVPGSVREYLPRALPRGVAQQVYLETRSIPRKQRRRLVSQYAEKYGCSTDTVYRAMRVIDRKQQPQVATRADAGTHRTIDPEWIRVAWEMQWSSRDPSRRNRMASSVQVIRLCEANGLIPQGAVTPSTYNRLVVQLGLRTQQSRIRIEPDSVNLVHYLDASGTRYLYIVKELAGNDYLLTIRPPAPNADTRKYKAIRSLWYVGLIDGASRCTYIRLFATVGEDTFTILNFLQEAWKFHPEVPFGGIPQVLQTDNGAFGRNHVVQQFFAQETIGVKMTRTMPYAKEAQGKIERTWRTVKGIEHPLLAIARKYSTWTIKLSEYNDEFLAHWMQDHANSEHPVHRGRTRADLWREAMARQTLRAVPDNLAELTWWSEPRVLTAYADLQVKRLRHTPHEGWYHHPDTRMARRRIMVIANMAGEVLFRDPLNPEVDDGTIAARPGRRETQPSWDEIDDDGEKRRNNTLYRTGAGLGRTKTSMDQIEVSPAVPNQPLIHPYQVPGEGIRVASLAPHQEQPPAVSTPISEHRDGDFFDSTLAKRWIAERLQTDLIDIQANHPAVWIEIEDQLEKTLDRQIISSQCDRWEERLYGHRYMSRGGS